MKEIKPKKEYKIFFCIDKGEIREQNKEENEEKHVEIINYFYFYDYNLNSTILNLKEFFLTNFGEKYKYCKCELSVYTKRNNKYQILSNFDDFKLFCDKLYLIKIKNQCDCKNKISSKYIKRSKFDIIAELKKNEGNFTKLKKELEQIIEKNKELQKEIEKLKKTEEIRNHIDAKIEDFYDIIIDINSIKNVNKEGWKVIFNELGLKKYNTYKDEELITIGVIGNSNKGKSFLLSKISKIKLLTGASIQTKGLSVKYPDLKGYEGRQLILLDSAGLETPVLGKSNSENKNKSGKEYDKEKEIIQNLEFKKNARDKIITELFLENLINLE